MKTGYFGAHADACMATAPIQAGRPVLVLPWASRDYFRSQSVGSDRWVSHGEALIRCQGWIADQTAKSSEDRWYNSEAIWETAKVPPGTFGISESTASWYRTHVGAVQGTGRQGRIRRSNSIAQVGLPADYH